MAAVSAAMPEPVDARHGTPPIASTTGGTVGTVGTGDREQETGGAGGLRRWWRRLWQG